MAQLLEQAQPVPAARAAGDSFSRLRPEARHNHGVAPPSLWRRWLIVCAAALASVGFSIYASLPLLTFQSITAYSALGPILGVGLLAVSVARWRWVLSGGLSRVDYAVACPPLLLSVYLLVLGMDESQNSSWATRFDLLAFPFILAAFSVLAFGARILVVGAFPFAFGIVAWPLPWAALDELVSRPVATFTGQVTAAIVTVTNLGEPLSTTGDMVLRVATPGGGMTELAVASACSGLASVSAFLLMGPAGAYLLQGKLSRKLAWVASAVVVVFCANVVRIVVIVVTTRLIGPGFSVSVLHPVAGLIVTNAVVVVWLALRRRFGLEWQRHSPMTGGTPAHPLLQPSARSPLDRSLRLRFLVVSLIVVVLVALDMRQAVVPTSYANGYSPRSSPLTAAGAGTADFAVTSHSDQPWADVYFGSDSAWRRYRWIPRKGGDAPRFTAWVDSITTSQPASFRIHSVEACYKIHRTEILHSAPVALGDGVRATQMRMRTPTGAEWLLLYWEWPVRRVGGMSFERVAIFASARDGLPAGTAVTPDERDGPALTDGDIAARLVRNARELVHRDASGAGSGTGSVGSAS